MFFRRAPIAILSLMMIGLTGCAPGLDPLPSERIVSIGFEDVVGETDWAELRANLDRANATGVNIAVGRPDWTAFPWPSMPEAWSAQVVDSGVDFVERALAEVRGPSASGEQRTVTLTLDALVPGWISSDHTIAGVNPEGEESESFASVSSLSSGGEVSERVVTLVDYLSRTYSPDAIALTELMFDDYTFGDDDRESYTEHTRNEDWPRTDDGDVDIDQSSIPDWRSDTIAGLVERVTDAARPFGVTIDMDVRSPRSGDETDRRESGHNYDQLLEVADRIVVWNYPGLEDDNPDAGQGITAAVSGRDVARITLSVGLWGEDGTLEPARFERALRDSAATGVSAVSVTPRVLLTDPHWDVLERVWNR